MFPKVFLNVVRIIANITFQVIIHFSQDLFHRNHTAQASTTYRQQFSIQTNRIKSVLGRVNSSVESEMYTRCLELELHNPLDWVGLIFIFLECFTNKSLKICTNHTPIKGADFCTNIPKTVISHGLHEAWKDQLRFSHFLTTC